MNDPRRYPLEMRNGILASRYRSQPVSFVVVLKGTHASDMDRTKRVHENPIPVCFNNFLFSRSLVSRIEEDLSPDLLVVSPFSYFCLPVCLEGVDGLTPLVPTHTFIETGSQIASMCCGSVASDDYERPRKRLTWDADSQVDQDFGFSEHCLIDLLSEIGCKVVNGVVWWL
jgi:hypothetical protein